MSKLYVKEKRKGFKVYEEGGWGFYTLLYLLCSVLLISFLLIELLTGKIIFSYGLWSGFLALVLTLIIFIYFLFFSRTYYAEVFSNLDSAQEFIDELRGEE